MKVTRQDLDKATHQKIISAEQADKLFHFLKAQPSTGPVFDVTHILYYGGGFVAIAAMTLLMNLGWEQFGGWGILGLSLIYAVASLLLTNHFRHKGHAIPAGICAVFAVALTPLAIYGFQQGMGFWPSDIHYQDYHQRIRWQWIYMELGTLAVGAIIAWYYRYPFLQMPIAITLWYLSMDAIEFIHGDTINFQSRALITMYFGLAMTLFAFVVDLRSAKSGDYAFWLYLFGVITFWGGLSCQDSDSELTKFLYFCINISLVVAGAALIRKVFVVFGAIGCFIYLYHLADIVFKNSWLFPIVLTAIGLAIIYSGLLWQKHEAAITLHIRRYLPTPLRTLLEQRAI